MKKVYERKNKWPKKCYPKKCTSDFWKCAGIENSVIIEPK